MPKQKMPKNVEEKNLEKYALLAMLVSSISGLALSIVTKQIIFFPAFVLTAMAIYLLYSNSLLFFFKTKKLKLRKEQLEFFQQFLEYSSLMTSYQKGFQKAYESIPISPLKDKICDELEKEKFDYSILHLDNSRAENEFLDRVSFLMLQEEEAFSYSDHQYLISLFQEYENASTVKSSVSFLLSFFPMICFLGILLFFNMK
ncbi:MAG: hypothetical protein IJ194_02255 [Bacilli bacterium]|nr:hypothetical protein [Bacilli bacterium]